MISDDIALSSILINFEQVLQIEHSEMSTERTIRAAKASLENKFKCEFNDTLYNIQAKNRLVSEDINMLLEQITEALKSLALYNSMCLFTGKVPINLADVNYIGFDASHLRVALRYLQNKNTYIQRDNIIPPIRAAVSNIEPCDIKRLFIILFMLDDLGVYDGAAVVATLLYLGGIK